MRKKSHPGFAHIATVTLLPQLTVENYFFDIVKESWMLFSCRQRLEKISHDAWAKIYT